MAPIHPAPAPRHRGWPGPLAAAAVEVALALAFANGLLGVLLGRDLHVGVVVVTYLLEALLGALLFAAVLVALGLLLGRGQLAAARRRTFLLAGSLVPLLTGWLWLHDAGRLDDPAHALLPALAWLAAVALVTLLAALGLRRCEGEVAPARVIGGVLAALVVLALLRRIRLPGVEPDAILLPALYALAGVGALALALGFRAPRDGAATPRRSGRRLVGALAGELAGLAAVALAVQAAGVVAAPSPATPRAATPRAATSAPGAAAALAPNLVLISIDTLRADHVGCYGYRRDTTPVLDRLAAQGARFAAAATTAPWTLPAHRSLLASRFPGELAEDGTHPPPTLAPALRRAGYRTAAFTAGYLVDAGRFGDGFDRFDDGHEDAYVHGTTPVLLRFARIARGLVRERGIGATLLAPLNCWREGPSAYRGEVSCWAGPLPSARAAAAWVADQDGGAPFFLFLHTFGVHEYYLNSPPTRDQAARWAGGDDGWLGAGGSLEYGWRMPAGADLAHLVTLYDGAIRATDAAVGELLAAVDRRPGPRPTLVVVVSDHGEGFRPDLERTWHRRRLHDDLLRVPLLVRFPALIPPGLVVPDQVSLIDVVPTVLALLGRPPLPGARGRSLVPLLAGNPLADAPVAAVPAFASTAEPAPRFHGVAVRTAGHKYIRMERSGEELYDLERDPGEERDLAASGDAALVPLREECQRWAEAAAAAAPLGADTLEVMRSLGYVD